MAKIVTPVEPVNGKMNGLRPPLTAPPVFAVWQLRGDRLKCCRPLHYSEEEIFELCVNTSCFGSGYYGVGEAAVGYFGKVPSELSEYERAMLAGIPNAHLSILWMKIISWLLGGQRQF